MANVEKYNRAQLGHMIAHYERRTIDGNHIRFQNQNIDTTKSYLNYNLAPERNAKEYIKERCSQVQCNKRKDLNVMATWCVTVPQDLKPSQHHLFFQETYNFICNRYGKENVVSAHIHNDETTPHGHYSVIPVYYDREREIHTINAKELINRKDLITFHKDLDAHLKSCNIECHVINGVTEAKGGNKPLKQYKENPITLEDIISNATGERKEELLLKEIESLSTFMSKFQYGEQTLYDIYKVNRSKHIERYI